MWPLRWEDEPFRFCRPITVISQSKNLSTRKTICEFRCLRDSEFRFAKGQIYSLNAIFEYAKNENYGFLFFFSRLICRNRFSRSLACFFFSLGDSRFPVFFLVFGMPREGSIICYCRSCICCIRSPAFMPAIPVSIGFIVSYCFISSLTCLA